MGTMELTKEVIVFKEECPGLREMKKSGFLIGFSQRPSALWG